MSFLVNGYGLIQRYLPLLYKSLLFQVVRVIVYVAAFIFLCHVGSEFENLNLKTGTTVSEVGLIRKKSSIFKH